MTTSGTNTFNLTRNEIIELALTRIGVKTFNRSLTAGEITQATLFLNTMIKSWKNKGLNLWKSKQGILFTTVGQASYKLDGTTANATEEYFVTALAADAVSGATSITVDDASELVIGYFIGVMQDDNTSHWTTIANIVGSVITLTAALTADASEDNYVYAYQTKISRPEGISSLRLQLDPTIEVPNVINSNDSYFNIPVKSVAGIPNTFYYDKQLTYGMIYLWPIPNVNTYFCKFTYQELYDDFTTPTSTPDFPQEWLKALYLGLAYDLCGAYGKMPDESLKRDAEQALTEAEGYDREDVTVYIQPATTNNIYTYR